ncbi:MAG: NUDIX hydrolase [Marinilabiliales bacterium]|nr:MAG: NUDIX hydrolase [Marinilabiliales bacterium]
MFGENKYPESGRFNVAVDCIVFGFDDDRLQLLLVKRMFEPCRNCWSLMGGFVGSDENLDDAAARILNRLTGLDDVYLEQLYTYGEPDRDPGGRVISVAYYALIRTERLDESAGDGNPARWFSFDSLPELVFDHAEMVDKAIKRLRRKSLIQPVGFELLPEKFTLTQLQKLYEAIHQRKLDKRNFRKRILSMDVLTRLDEKDRVSSKRGAWLYRFDSEKYDRLIGSGDHFEM